MTLQKMTLQQERKQAIRKFMQDHYSDERLAMLLAHAKDGKLSFYSCCCFVGQSRADHALQGRHHALMMADHLCEARGLEGANAAEQSFAELSENPNFPDSDIKRRRILIPMIRAEMKRREMVKKRPAQRLEAANQRSIGNAGQPTLSQ